MNVRSLVVALDGSERPYPVYRFSGRYLYEKPRNNPFAGIVPDPTPPPPDPPAGVINLVVSNVTTNSADLDWTDISDNEDTIEVEQADNIDFIDRKIAILPADTIALTITGLDPSTTYYWRVRARNADGDSQYSNTVQAETLAIPVPAPPTDLDANSTANSGEIQLTWTDVATGELGYYVNRRISKINKKGKEAGFEEWERIDTIAADSSAYLDTGLLDGRLYQYTVEPYSLGGSDLSNIAGARPQLPFPAAPTLLIASSGGALGEVDLSWTDNSADENGFEIERSDDGLSGWTLITTTAPDVTAYTDTGTPGDTYFYRVRATNDRGPSDYSNVASAQAKPAFDPLYDSNVVFHLQPTEADDATDMEEVSPWRKNLIRSGSPTVEDTVQKFPGQNSLYFVAAQNDYLYVYDGAGHFTPDESFTCEGWFYPTWFNGAAAQAFFGTRNGLEGWTLYRNTDNTLNLQGYRGSLTPFINLSSTETLSLNTWHHIAVEYKHSTGQWSVYLDGTRVAQGTQGNAIGIYPIFYVGTQSGTTRRYEGYLFDVRVTRGVLRYDDATYTVPGGPMTRGEFNYPVAPDNCVLLETFDQNANNWNLVGSAAHTTVDKKFGNGALSLPGSTTPETNYAYFVDGGRWFDMQTHGNTGIDGGFFLDFWVKLNARPGTEDEIIMKWVPASNPELTTGTDRNWAFIWTAAGGFRWDFYDNGSLIFGLNLLTYTNSGDGSWVRFTLSCYRGNARAYVNGNYQGLYNIGAGWQAQGQREDGDFWLVLGAGDSGTWDDPNIVIDSIRYMRNADLDAGETGQINTDLGFHTTSPGGDIQPRFAGYEDLSVVPPAGRTDPTVDIHYDSVISLLQFDGTNGSTTFTDEKGLTWTAVNGAVISTAQSKFGGSSLYVPAAADCIINAGTACALGDGAFTLEFWVRHTGQTGNVLFFDQRENVGFDGPYGTMYTTTSGTVPRWWTNGADQRIGAAWMTANVWHHYAITRDDDLVLRQFLNGQMTPWGGQGGHGVDYTTDGNTRIGSSGPFPLSGVVGYFDSFRITKGVCRYDRSFIRPESAFPTTGP